MPRHRAFTSEWMIGVALIAVELGLWTPLVSRFTGWSQPVSACALLLLAFLLFLLCGLLEERNARWAHALGRVFLLGPLVLWLLLLVGALLAVLVRRFL